MRIFQQSTKYLKKTDRVSEADRGALLGHRLAHLAHHVLDPGFAALVALPPFFVLSGPLHCG